MRAIQIARLDGPQAAEVVEIDEPDSDGGVVVEVHAAGVSFPDALRTRGRLAAGETVLVHGAAGGIGTSTLRLAPAWGASRTIAVVSTDDKVEVAKAAGASDVVLADGFKDAVMELTDGRGVDI